MRATRTTIILLTGLLLLSGCSWPTLSPSVETLAKVEGWRPGLEEDAFAVLEIAYDDDAARALWEENVPADLPRREGTPLDAGVFGELGDVDFAEQVVALYSSGQSGSCPGWVRDVDHDGAGTVDVTRAEDMRGGDGCTDDYNAFRVVVALDREDVPDRADLPGVTGTVDGLAVLTLVVGEYPVDP